MVKIGGGNVDVKGMERKLSECCCSSVLNESS
jgi:hypothetical protein